jgi:formylglycine-generating enzyme required for sulfatase activity
MQTILSFIFIFWAAFFGIAAEREALGKGPQIVIPEMEFDVGLIDVDRDVPHDFLIHNQGDEPLVVSNVITSCGLAKGDYDRTINPGKTGKISLVLRPSPYWAGKNFTKRTTVLTNDPKLPNFILNFIGKVKDLRQSIQSEVITNSIGMKLRLIPAGNFVRALPKELTKDKKDKGPEHKVNISKAFYIGIYEVTQGEFEAIMGASANKSQWKGDNLPVEQLNWFEASEFCRRLSEKEGRNYRLPTEAEWEYACRAGSTTEFFWGDKWLEGYAWSFTNSDGRTHEVGNLKPNAWGLYDMSGNVWEWTSEWYSPYIASEQTDPQGPLHGSTKVLRGGSWLRTTSSSRCAHRGENTPDCWDNHVGLRVVMMP